jgi:hypothetical protein
MPLPSSTEQAGGEGRGDCSFQLVCFTTAFSRHHGDMKIFSFYLQVLAQDTLRGAAFFVFPFLFFFFSRDETNALIVGAFVPTSSSQKRLQTPPQTQTEVLHPVRQTESFVACVPRCSGDLCGDGPLLAGFE